MNDNIDGFQAEDEEFWIFMERQFNTKTLVHTETIEQMFDRCMRISHFVPKSKEQLWIECADKLTEACKRFGAFARSTFMFRFDRIDKIILIQNGVFQAIPICMSRYIDPSTNCILFNKTILPERAFYTTDMEEIDLVSSLFNFAKDIANLKLTVAELAIYSAIVVCNHEPLGLAFRNQIKSQKEFLLRALKAELDHSDRQPLENGVTVYDALIAKIPELRMIGFMYDNAVAKFRRSHPHVSLPSLHEEMFIRHAMRAIAA